MYFLKLFYNRQSTLISIIPVLCLIYIGVFCEAYWLSPSASAASTNQETQYNSPENCARECQDGEKPKNCYYHFVLEYYTTNNLACNFCNTSTNSSGITSTCQCVIGDGIEKTVFAINRMIPGPSIQVCKGDYIVIDVQNDAEGLEASLHWHGIFQNGYQYYDGVPYLTQCPILSGDTFRYQYKVKNSGTHFYHAHISVHMIDGEYGSLIVRDPPNLNPHYDLYDEDRPEHVIVISDWMHELSLERFPGRYRSNRGQVPQNFLVNGRGNWTDPITGMSSNVQLSTFNVKSGKRYRFRMINACSTVCLIEVKIQEHSMQIIATDGENIKPVVVDAINMASGERYDFVLHANQTPGYYWLHVRGLGECEINGIYQLAIIMYQGSSELSLSPKPGYSDLDSSERIFNPINSTNCGNDLCVDQLQKIYLPNENEVSLIQQPDILLPMSFDFFNYTTQLNLLFNTQNQEYKRFYVSPTGSYLDSLLNNISYQDPPGPPISQNEYEFMCGRRYTSSKCTEPCTCTNVYHVTNHAIVDIMIYDKKPMTDLNHPFHLHGYSFCVLYAAQFDNANNKDDISDNDVIKEIYAHRHRLRNGYYKTCSPKDTVIVPNTGFIIFRFKADNPGWWFLHCHFTWHTATGMNVVLHVGQSYDLPPIPSDFPECYNWTPN